MVESIFAIGFSGHRDLPNPERVEREIGKLLDDIAKRTSNRLIGVCSAAIGADMIFIEACLGRNLAWIAILPMPPEMFFNEKDFPDERVRRHAIQLLETATSIEITNPVHDRAMKYDKEYRHIAFSDSGRRIVDYCDLFIGALRQSDKPHKPGGTGDIIDYARLSHRPMAIINPENGSIEHHDWHPPFRSAFVREIATLPEAPLRQDLLPLESSRELTAVVDFFSRLTAEARRRVPRVRNITSFAAIANGALAVLTLAFVLMHWAFSPAALSIAHGVEMVLAFFAALVTGWFFLAQPRIRATRYRLGAEICRSVIATWSLAETQPEIFRGLPLEYREFVRTLLNFRRLEGGRTAQTDTRQSGGDEWRNRIAIYLRDRLNNQIKYYEREQKKAGRRLHIFKPAIAVFGVGNFVIAASLWMMKELKGHSVIGPRETDIVSFCKVAFPVVTTTLLAIVAAREATRRKTRYGEMVEVLKENAARLDSAPHLKAACEIVIDTERTLLAENIEWANMAKYSATP